MIVRLSHYLIEDYLRVPPAINPLNPEFGGDAQTIDQCLILCHIVGSVKVQSNNVKESVFFRRDQHYASPGTIEGAGAVEIHALMLLGEGGAESQSIWPQNPPGPGT
jgi:hypothetical protein